MYCSFAHAFSHHQTILLSFVTPVSVFVLCSLHFHSSEQGYYLFTGNFTSFLVLLTLIQFLLSYHHHLSHKLKKNFSLLSILFFIFTLICLNFEVVYQFFIILTLFLINLQYCKDNIVSLNHGLNFLLSTSNSPVLISHISYFSLFNVHANCSPSLPSQLSMTGIFSSSCMLQLLLMKFFFYISKFNSFW